jgi:hypothetical protein
MQQRQSLQDYFKAILQTVLGQAFSAAGYELEQMPLKWINGQFRYRKALHKGLYGIVEFQVLVYSDTAWAPSRPSRFQVTLIRADNPGGKPSQHPDYARRTLPQLVVADFGVAILPSADHWWPFQDTDSLGKALAEAGHLVIGYGIPWLGGDLSAENVE